MENVQEPEESDVCLIPDDTESTVTDAEKEQAILARENAEKDGENQTGDTADQEESTSTSDNKGAEEQAETNPPETSAGE